MDTQKIIEGNRLIAEFMGAKSSIVDNMYFGIDGFLYLKEDLRYHFSWDWLMPVVEKIEKTNFGTIDIKSHGVCFVSFNKKIESYYSGSLIVNTWEAVVNFISWHTSKEKA